MTYADWVKALEAFKAASRDCSYESDGLIVKPGEASRGTVEIITRDDKQNKLHVFINKEQAQALIMILNNIYEL